MCTRLFIFVLLIAGLVAPLSSQAQTIPGSADAGRIGDRVVKTPEFRKAGPNVTIPTLSVQGAPKGSDNIRFTLRDINFDGAGVLSKSDLSSVYSDKIGAEISLTDLYAIAGSLTNFYREKGYVLTQVVVPPQTIGDGTPTLQVVEGRIANVTVTGDDERSLGLIRSYASLLQDQPAVSISDLERTLLLINDLPGVTARSILSPSQTPGAADLQIIIDRDTYEAQVGVDNFGSRFLGREQLNAGGALNSILNNNERFSSQVVFAPGSSTFDRELAYGDISYLQPIGKYGTTISLLGSATETSPGFSLSEFEIKGHSRYARGTVNHPWVRSRDFSLYTHGVLDFRTVESESNIEPERVDRIRTARIGIDAELLDSFFTGGYNNFSIEGSKGLSWFDASDEGDANLSRPDGDPQFTKYNAEIQRLQRVTNSFNLLVGVKGQYSEDSLLTSEEFGLGGMTGYVRGYDPSEVIGEHGLAGKLELQWNQPFTASFLPETQLYGFYDAGRVWNKDATTSAGKNDYLSSTGFGMRASLFGTTDASFTVAVPLNRDVETTGDQDARFFFSLGHRF